MNRQWRNHMVDMLNKLKKSEHLRQDLIQLKETIKSSEAKEKQELSKALEEEREFVKELLFHEDAKVRKNMVTIIGDLSIASFQEEIFAGFGFKKYDVIICKILKKAPNMICIV